jgi:4-hydroxy-tetrahydrodipicolinate synthase
LSEEARAEFRPHGVIAAAVTPFKEDESLDESRLAAHLDFLIRAGVDGVMPIGGSGEYVNLSADERRRVIDCAIAAVDGRVPVVVGALGPSTREALEVGFHAQASGADALLVLPPYYIRPSREGIVDHFARITAETGLPVIVYNNPPRAGIAIDLGTLHELADLPGVVGLKDCDRDVGAIEVKIEEVGEQIAILSGDDDLEFVTLLAGASGGIWATVNLAPRLCIELYRACASGELERARALQAVVRTLVNIRKLPNHPGPLKEMMKMAGLDVGPSRRPLVPMTNGQRTAVAEVVARYSDFLGDVDIPNPELLESASA